jgi:hypothetical protein
MHGRGKKGEAEHGFDFIGLTGRGKMTIGWRGHQWPWRAPAALMEIKGALKRGGNGRRVVTPQVFNYYHYR